MDPSALTPLLRDYGPWGLLALALGAVVYLFKRIETLQDARVADGRVALTLLAEVKLAMVAVTAALESRQGYFERIGNQVEDEGRKTDTNLKLALERLGDIQRRLEDIRGRA